MQAGAGMAGLCPVVRSGGTHVEGIKLAGLLPQRARSSKGCTRVQSMPGYALWLGWKHRSRGHEAVKSAFAEGTERSGLLPGGQNTQK